MLWAAFITGLLGSIHCAGMCGPLLCAMPFRRDGKGKEWLGLLVYNSGRMVSYAGLGLLTGLGGAGLLMFTGKWFAYIAGTVLLVWGVYKLAGGRWREPAMPPFVRRIMGKLFRSRSPFALPLLGMLNGLLPCGMVYAALAGAAVTAHPLTGALYMLLFGLATWPALFSGYYLAGRMAGGLRRYYRPATAVFMCLLGGLLWARGLRESFTLRQPESGISVCR